MCSAGRVGRGEGDMKEGGIRLKFEIWRLGVGIAN